MMMMYWSVCECAFLEKGCKDLFLLTWCLHSSNLISISLKDTLFFSCFFFPFFYALIHPLYHHPLQPLSSLSQFIALSAWTILGCPTLTNKSSKHLPSRQVQRSNNAEPGAGYEGGGGTLSTLRL